MTLLLVLTDGAPVRRRSRKSLRVAEGGCPVDLWLFSLGQETVGVREGLAVVEAKTCGERGGVCGLDHFVIWVRDQLLPTRRAVQPVLRTPHSEIPSAGPTSQLGLQPWRRVVVVRKVPKDRQVARSEICRYVISGKRAPGLQMCDRTHCSDSVPGTTLASTEEAGRWSVFGCAPEVWPPSWRWS